MRIGQLARQIGISPSEIIEFLSAQNIETESGTNARLTEDVAAKILERFAPEKKAEVIETIAEEGKIEEEKIESETSAVSEEPAPLEVIRVSKVELQGLKVVGKIDLPEPKKKPEPLVEKREYQPRQSQPKRDWKNPLDAKRKQEAREAEQKRREKAEQEKEKRTNHYYNKVKSVPTKAAKKVEEQVVVEDLNEKEPPKSALGRLWRWLTT